jgi:hypothetical protein
MASTDRLNKPSGNPPALTATNPPLAVQAMLKVKIERALWDLVNVQRLNRSAALAVSIDR